MSANDSSSTPPESTPRDPAKARRSAILVFLGMAFVFGTPWLFALFWRPDGRVNFGELIQPPAALVSARLASATGDPLSTDDLRKKWRWATVVTSSCDAGCQETLYTLRQARLALGKNAPRVRYTVVVLDGRNGTDVPVESGANTEHPMLEVLRADGDDASRLKAQFETVGGLNAVVLIDPLGNVILRYPADIEEKKLKKDIDRLLRGSHIG